MACRAVKCSSSHSYCPSLLHSSLPLFCLSRFSLWLSHLSPSVTSLHVFFSSCTLHLSCSVCLIFTFRPVLLNSLFVSPSHYILFFLTSTLSASLPHTPSIFSFLLDFSSALSLTLCRRGHCAGQTALRGLPAMALTFWEVGNQTDPP